MKYTYIFFILHLPLFRFYDLFCSVLAFLLKATYKHSVSYCSWADQALRGVDRGRVDPVLVLTLPTPRCHHTQCPTHCRPANPKLPIVFSFDQHVRILVLGAQNQFDPRYNKSVGWFDRDQCWNELLAWDWNQVGSKIRVGFYLWIWSLPSPLFFE